ncbi:MAG: PPOX class F420-dependent oxidoreductase [Pseudomonadales bacterium]
MSVLTEQQATLGAATYISLATFRKSGAKVATPVWCAPQGDWLYIFSESKAGKIKRLRNSSQAQLALCDFRGKLLGPWHLAQAEIISEAAEIDRALAALRKKYGWQMWLADTGARLVGRYQARAYIKVRLSGATVTPQ